MVGERIQNAVQSTLGDEPVLRRVGDRLDDRSSNIRNRQSARVQTVTPSLPRRNIGDGMAVGVIGSALEDLISTYVPIGSDTEVVGVTGRGDGIVYTINTDAVFENMAKAEGFMESGTGFTSFVTDKIDVENAEVLRTRPLRDTYQVEVYVED